MMRIRTAIGRHGKLLCSRSGGATQPSKYERSVPREAECQHHFIQARNGQCIIAVIVKYPEASAVDADFWRITGTVPVAYDRNVASRSVDVASVHPADSPATGVIDKPDAVEKDSHLRGAGTIPVRDDGNISCLTEPQCGVTQTSRYASQVPAEVEDEGSLPEEPQRHSPGTSPVAHNGNVPGLPERDGFVPCINHAVAVGIENPGSVAEDTNSLRSGSGPVANDRKVGRYPEQRGRNVR